MIDPDALWVLLDQAAKEACVEVERALQCLGAAPAGFGMGAGHGILLLRVDQELAAKSETVHGERPLGNASDAMGYEFDRTAALDLSQSDPNGPLLGCIQSFASLDASLG